MTTDTKPDLAGTGDLIKRLRARGTTMNGARPVGAGDGDTYVLGHYHYDDSLMDLQAADALEEAERANRTRPDYDLRCDECGRAHILDTSLPSETWNQIAEPGDVLCTVCIDARLVARGLTAEAEFYYAGTALQSKLYEYPAALEAAERVIAPFSERANRYDDTKVSTINDGVELWQLEGNVGWRVDLTVGHLRAARDWLAAHATGQRKAIHLDIPPMPEGAPAVWGHRDPTTLYWLPVILKGPCAVTQWYVELPCGKTTIIDAEDHAELVPVSTGQRQWRGR